MKSRLPVAAWITAAAAFAALITTGCGPIEAMTVINDAEIALSGARAARAHDHSPYEYYTAELYLEKAREERGFAHFGRAIQYGRKAGQSAREAQTRSMSKLRERPGSPESGLQPYDDGDNRSSRSGSTKRE